MPDPKDNAKASGDVHPPEVEEARRSRQGEPGPQGAQGTPGDRDLSRDLENEGRAGKGINQAGYLKDKDAPGMGKEDGSKSS